MNNNVAMNNVIVISVIFPETYFLEELEKRKRFFNNKFGNFFNENDANNE